MFAVLSETDCRARAYECLDAATTTVGLDVKREWQRLADAWLAIAVEVAKFRAHDRQQPGSAPKGRVASALTEARKLAAVNTAELLRKRLSLPDTVDARN